MSRWTLTWTREAPVPGETKREAALRSERNRRARAEWERLADQRCAKCGHVRFHVFHEPNPATSPEGADYYADILDELHPFEEAAS